MIRIALVLLTLALLSGICPLRVSAQAADKLPPELPEASDPTEPPMASPQTSPQTEPPTRAEDRVPGSAETRDAQSRDTQSRDAQSPAERYTVVVFGRYDGNITPIPRRCPPWTPRPYALATDARRVIRELREEDSLRLIVDRSGEFETLPPMRSATHEARRDAQRALHRFEIANHRAFLEGLERIFELIGAQPAGDTTRILLFVDSRVGVMDREKARETIRMANTRQLPIDIRYVSRHQSTRQFYESIAADSGGEATRIDHVLRVRRY